MLANHPETQKVHYAFQLRNAKEGWKFEERTFYFRWLSEAQKRTGGASYVNFLKNIDKEAYENANDVDRLAIESTGVRKPWTMPAIPKPVGPGRMWKMEELLSLSETKLKERDFKNGKQAYSSARCVVCHRFANEGGATGPDLTQLAGRFGPKEVLESIVEPSKVISDQYRTTIVATKDGKIYTGRILLDEKESLTMLVSPEDPTKISKFAKQDIEEMKPSSVSLMPADLLHGLNENEVLDLLAYLLSRGNPNDARFKK
jgi:putative heme-binding domain-containing protein